MDNSVVSIIMDVIIGIFLLIFCVILPIVSIIKQQKQQQPIPKKSVGRKTIQQEFGNSGSDMKTEIYGGNDMNSEGSTLAENSGNIPKEVEYFTYEESDNIAQSQSNRVHTRVSNQSQTIDNQKDIKPVLTFDPEEIYKGIIYSEILNRKYK